MIQKAVLPFVHTWTEVKLSRVINELLHELDTAGAKRRHRQARTLLDLDEHPGHLDGYGPIDADTARALAAAGTWRWVGTAPAGGHALDYGTTRYTPPQNLVDHVILRDRECIAPGCHRPAQRCEIDHRTPWPHGPTSACNCSALCKPP